MQVGSGKNERYARSGPHGTKHSFGARLRVACFGSSGQDWHHDVLYIAVGAWNGDHLSRPRLLLYFFTYQTYPLTGCLEELRENTNFDITATGCPKPLK